MPINMEQVKLVWDFRGMDAKQFAEHHAIHLKQYALAENLKDTNTGIIEVEAMHCYAFLTVNKENMIQVRDALRPHRGLKA